MSSRPVHSTKLLFVCSRNQKRSLTAESIFQHTPGFQVRSAGTESSARVRVTAGLIGWADVVFVMERRHADILRGQFGDILDSKNVICLRIPDDFEFMDPALISLLQAAVAEHLG